MLQKTLLILGALVVFSAPVSAVVQNKDGSVVLSEKEITVLLTSVAQTESERDELMNMVKELKKQLEVEQSKKCI